MLFKHFIQEEVAFRRRSCNCLKSLKIICEEVNLWLSWEMWTCKLTKKSLSYIILQAFCLHFLKIHYGYFFMITISFRKYKWKKIYLFSDDSFKSTFFMLNMAFNVLFFWSKNSTVFKCKNWVNASSVKTNENKLWNKWWR